MAMPFYEEILELVAGGRQDWPEWVEPQLVGDHDHPAAAAHACADPVCGGIIRQMVRTWPAPPAPLRLRGAGGELRDWRTDLFPVGEEVRLAFAPVLRAVLGPLAAPGAGGAWAPECGGSGVLPNPRDRLAWARRRLGGPRLLWNQPVHREEGMRPGACVYLDVSGSMAELLLSLLGLLAPYAAAGLARVCQFSTEVTPLSTTALRRGEVQTSGGTDINCVLRHALGAAGLRKIVVVTDGYTGTPEPGLAQGVRQRRLQLQVVLTAERSSPANLQGVATGVHVLPRLQRPAAVRLPAFPGRCRVTSL